MEKERRKTPRIAQYAGLNITEINGFTAKPKLNHEVILDISETGIKATIWLSRKRTFLKDTELKMEIMLRDEYIEDIIEVKGKIVWMKELTKEEKYSYYIGIEFNEIDRIARERIKKIVKEKQ